MRATSPLDRVTRGFDAVKRQYDQGRNDLETIGQIASDAIRLLSAEGTTTAERGRTVLDGQTKVYQVRNRGPVFSRPIRQDLFITDARQFERAWRELIGGIDSRRRTARHPHLDGILYTAAIAFAVAFDLYRPASRKTPGTFFEVMMGTVLGAATGLPRAKQITLPDSRYKVPTDIVLQGMRGKPNLVIPTKITTRERVVQPWAHQRILDDAFGRGRYKSVLAVVSELQRAEGRVNEICLPGQVGLFQKYLAQLYGMYYLDPPAAYMRPDFVALLPTKSLSALLGSDLRVLLEL